jgi:hypothetical protein
MPQSARDQVFISYSHKDEEWLGKLRTMLKPMVRNKIVSVWEDTKISVGEEWRDEIKGALAAAKAAVLLVSPNFLDSDFIAEYELPPLLEAAEKQGLVILWVYLSHCLYDETEIKRYQAANEISKPLDSLTPSEQNAALVNVCKKIKAADFTRSVLAKCVRTLEGHTLGVRGVAFSPDGALLTLASLDKTVRLWRVPDGALVRALEGHASAVRGVAFSPDGAPGLGVHRQNRAVVAGVGRGAGAARGRGCERGVQPRRRRGAAGLGVHR